MSYEKDLMRSLLLHQDGYGKYQMAQKVRISIFTGYDEKAFNG